MNREELIKEIDNATKAMREITRVVNETLCHARHYKSNEETEEAYNKGLDDAWELARKIYEMKSKEFDEVFRDVHYVDVFYHFTPQEALAIIETYEKSKEIKVGDVVELADGTKAVVMDKLNNDEDIVFFTENGCMEIWNIKSKFKKTNRHIDITSVLEQLKGE